MRPRRQALQVSTFPFLAVLLCAMGSLILLLLVIDRRAKAVARVKALQLVERQMADQSEVTARRLADFEQRRQALHDDLKHQATQLLEQIQSVRFRLTDVENDHKRETTRRKNLENEIIAIEGQIAEKRETIKTRQASLADAAPRDQKFEHERARMTEELTRLEKALADLKAIRSRDEQTYSLVPYKGKRGDNRRPIYVECNVGDLLLHPERRTVAVSDLRAGLEGRKPASADDDKPYVLFLVRPAGILTYYKTMGALEGMDVSFGYEFVEPEWVFDFSEQEPREVVKAPAAAQPSNRGLPGNPSNASIESSGPVLSPKPASMATPEGWTSGRAAPGRRLAAGSGGTKPTIAGATIGPGESRTIASSGPPAMTAIPLPEVTGNVGLPQPQAGGRAQALPAPPAATAIPLQQGGGNLGVSPQPGAPRPQADAKSNTVPAPPAVITGQPDQARNSMPQPTGQPGHSSPEQNGERSSAPPSIMDSPHSAPGRASRLPPSRDWVITVDCTADSVVVSPGALRFPIEPQKLGAAENPVLQTVNEMILRRQSMARSDEPAVRPVIHFRVRPEGLRAYYLIYPTLEVLRVPMTRETLPPEPERQPRRVGAP